MESKTEFINLLGESFWNCHTQFTRGKNKLSRHVFPCARILIDPKEVRSLRAKVPELAEFVPTYLALEALNEYSRSGLGSIEDEDCLVSTGLECGLYILPGRHFLECGYAVDVPSVGWTHILELPREVFRIIFRKGNYKLAWRLLMELLYIRRVDNATVFGGLTFPLLSGSEIFQHGYRCYVVCTRRHWYLESVCKTSELQVFLFDKHGGFVEIWGHDGLIFNLGNEAVSSIFDMDLRCFEFPDVLPLNTLMTVLEDGLADFSDPAVLNQLNKYQEFSEKMLPLEARLSMCPFDELSDDWDDSDEVDDESHCVEWL